VASVPGVTPLNTGGSLSPPATLPALNGSHDLATADMNQDGFIDLVMADTSKHVLILLGVGDGSFVAGSTLPAGNGAMGVTVADIDVDGLRDLVAAAHTITWQRAVFVWRMQSDGTFVAPEVYEIDMSFLTVAAADVNEDGWPDLSVSSPEFPQLLNLGDGTFGLPTTWSSNLAPQDSQAVMDANGDGHADVVSEQANHLLCMEIRCRKSEKRQYSAQVAVYDSWAWHHEDNAVSMEGGVLAAGASGRRRLPPGPSVRVDSAAGGGHRTARPARRLPGGDTLRLLDRG